MYLLCMILFPLHLHHHPDPQSQILPIFISRVTGQAKHKKDAAVVEDMRQNAKLQQQIQ